MLTKRDKAIIADLNKFRVMDRDSIAELHFPTLKNPQYAANNVLLRLLQDGHIQRSTFVHSLLLFWSRYKYEKEQRENRAFPSHSEYL